MKLHRSNLNTSPMLNPMEYGLYTLQLIKKGPIDERMESRRRVLYVNLNDITCQRVGNIQTRPHSVSTRSRYMFSCLEVTWSPREFVASKIALDVTELAGCFEAERLLHRKTQQCILSGPPFASVLLLVILQLAPKPCHFRMRAVLPISFFSFGHYSYDLHCTSLSRS